MKEYTSCKQCEYYGKTCPFLRFGLVDRELSYLCHFRIIGVYEKTSELINPKVFKDNSSSIRLEDCIYWSFLHWLDDRLKDQREIDYFLPGHKAISPNDAYNDYPISYS
ncbi:MAG TPA: hypothetical protein VH396_10015 [Chitinophagaceae bacterium]|jgi:hypothetical protein